MRLGISTGSFFPRSKTENAFDIIRSLGINVCEVFLTTFSEYLPEFGDILASLKGQIEVYSIHTLNQQFEPELYNSAERTRKDCEFFLHQSLKVGQKLDAKYYTFHGPARLKKRPYVFDYQKLGQRTDEICDICNEYGINLTYENVHWAFFNSPEFFSSLKQFSKVNACLDIKQAMQSDIDVYQYIDVIGSRLKNVHLCDYDLDGRLKMPGKGCFDFVKLFKKLYQIGYDGALMLEVYSGDYKELEELKYAYEYLYKCLKQAKKELK